MNRTTKGKQSLVLIAAALLILVLTSPPANAKEDRLPLLVQTLGRIEDANALQALMRGMVKGLEGQRHVDVPEQWPDVAKKLAAHENAGVRDLTNQLSQIFGDEAAVRKALAVVRDPAATPDERRRQLTMLLDQQHPEASELLVELLDVPELQLQAIRGFAAVENPRAPRLLLQRYPTAAQSLRRAIIETLATRKPYAEALLTAVKSNAVERENVPTHVARGLHTLLGNRFVEVFGEPPSLNADREQQLAKWKQRVTPDVLSKADASRGRVVFNKTCGTCHQMYGVGGKIGPDLTGSNRANLDYLLLNSIDPSYDVPVAYRMTTIVTVDGRVVNGVLAEEDRNRVVLKTVEKPRLVISTADIEERVISRKSMMPDGQLDALKARQVFDLIKYMQTREQVELAK